MRCLTYLVLIFVATFIAFKAVENHNIIRFTVNYFSENSPSFNAVKFLQTKWETIETYVNSNSNSWNLNGKFKLPDGLRKVVLQLHNDTVPESKIFVSLKQENGSLFIVRTDSYKINITELQQKLKTETFKLPLRDVCSCIRGNCACCLEIDVPEFTHSVCVNATYNSTTIGLDLSVGVDGHYFTQEISLRNPPPFCFTLPIPGAEPGICVAFTKLDIDKKAEILTGCIELDIELIHLKLVQIDLGCFQMPI